MSGEGLGLDAAALHAKGCDNCQRGGEAGTSVHCKYCNPPDWQNWKSAIAPTDRGTELWESFRVNLAIRLGLFQLEHGELGANIADKSRWEVLKKLAETGRLSVCMDGGVMLDSKVLTTEVLETALKEDKR
jgi:hypothetical protein